MLVEVAKELLEEPRQQLGSLRVSLEGVLARNEEALQRSLARVEDPCSNASFPPRDRGADCVLCSQPFLCDFANAQYSAVVLRSTKIRCYRARSAGPHGINSSMQQHG